METGKKTIVVSGKTRFAFVAILESLTLVFTFLRVTPCAAQDEEPSSHYMITSHPYGFELKCRPVRATHGELHPYTQELQLSDFPSSFSLPVGKFVRGIEFLVASELSARLTGVQVGEVELRYSAGAEGKEPLVYGRNIDCFTKPFATETDNYEIDSLSHLSAFVVKTDSSRILDSTEVYLCAADASVGILGINLILPE